LRGTGSRPPLHWDDLQQLVEWPFTLQERRSVGHQAAARFVINAGTLFFQADAVPQFQVQQTPDAVIVVTMSVAMLRKKTADRLRLEISALNTSRLQQQLLN